jgi:hypothetical protein
MRRTKPIFFVLLMSISMWGPHYMVSNMLDSETDVTSMVVGGPCRLMEEYAGTTKLLCPCDYQFTSAEIDTIWHLTMCSECDAEEIHQTKVPYEEIRLKLSYCYTMFLFEDPIDVYKLIVPNNGRPATWEIRRDQRGGLVLPFREWYDG